MIRASVLALLFIASPALCGNPADARFLRTRDNRIVDGEGRTVQLRGVNLGGWLVFEPWMCPMDSSGLEDDHSAREMLVKRFGEATANDLLRTYQENWITAGDFDRIAGQGLNLVRVPFWYRNVQTENGEWIPGGLELLDRRIAEAWKRGIYTILDLHGAPGGQTKGESTGRKRGKAGLWGSEPDLARTAAIWRRVAEHYRGNPAIAAYDLLNEPSEAPGLGALWTAYDRIYREIRAVDPDHIITVEGCINTRVGDKDIGWGWDALPHPDIFGWKNVLYQMHHYEWDWNHLEKQKRGVDFQVSEWNRHKSLKVPCFIGEFNPMAREEAWDHALREFNTAGLHWAFWSYKATHGTGSDSWGLFNPLKKDAPNLRTDDAAAIKTKWSAVGTDRSYALNPMLERVLGKARRQSTGTTPEK